MVTHPFAPVVDENCRTLEIDNIVYETIPQELIIQAGLRAAQQK